MVSKLKKIAIEKLEYCTGCCACMNVCEQGAVSMISNKEGFWYPSIDHAKCVGCNICVKNCQVLNEREFNEEELVTVYAAWSKNEKVRIDSTSGGIFSELAEIFFQNSGFVCGAVYGDQFRVEHYISKQESDLPRIRQSKYSQSYSGMIYSDICEKLKQNRNVLFCGTPCQVDALLRVMKAKKLEKRDNLLLVDFICRGSNSPKVYDKFLRKLESDYNSRVSRVWFKNKDNGWNNFHTKIEFENGEVYFKSRYEDSYIRGYIEENLAIRNSCTDCRFKGVNRRADITLGDFWGGVVNRPFEEIDKGTSVVMINTALGQKYWSEIKEKLYYESASIEDVKSGNVCLENSIEHSVHRKKFMRDIDRIDIIENIERYLKHDR